MKQLSTLFFLLVLTTALFAQDTPSILKKWKLTEIEEFGSKYPLTDVQQNDFLRKLTLFWPKIVGEKYSIYSAPSRIVKEGEKLILIISVSPAIIG